VHDSSDSDFGGNLNFKSTTLGVAFYENRS